MSPIKLFLAGNTVHLPSGLQKILKSPKYSKESLISHIAGFPAGYENLYQCTEYSCVARFPPHFVFLLFMFVPFICIFSSLCSSYFPWFFSFLLLCINVPQWVPLPHVVPPLFWVPPLVLFHLIHGYFLPYWVSIVHENVPAHLCIYAHLLHPLKVPSHQIRLAWKCYN